MTGVFIDVALGGQRHTQCLVTHVHFNREFNQIMDNSFLRNTVASDHLHIGPKRFGLFCPFWVALVADFTPLHKLSSCILDEKPVSHSDAMLVKVTHGQRAHLRSPGVRKTYDTTRRTVHKVEAIFVDAVYNTKHVRFDTWSVLLLQSILHLRCQGRVLLLQFLVCLIDLLFGTCSFSLSLLKGAQSPPQCALLRWIHGKKLGRLGPSDGAI